MRSRRAAVVGAAMVACLLTATGVAAGSPTWGAPVQLSPNGDGGEPVVAANARGDTVVGLQGLNSKSFEVISRSGGSQASSAPVVFPTGRGTDSAVAVDESGGAFSLFGTASFLQISERVGPTGEWRDAVTLNSEPMAWFDPQISLGAGGAVGVITTTCCPTQSVQATVRAAGAQLWSPLVGLSSGAVLLASSSIALDSAGNALAVWVESPGIVKASFRPAATAAWGTPVVLGEGSDKDLVADTRVAFDPAGNATATWIGTRQSVVSSAYRPFGGAWQPAVAISAGAAKTASLSLAVVPSGEALAVWVADGRVEGAARRSASQAWQAPTTISLATAPEGWLGLATDQAGNAVAIWTTSDFIQAALRPAANSVWQPPANVAPKSGYWAIPAVAMGATGHALAVWSQFGPSEGSDLDPSGPIITGLTVPRSATARVETHFAVTATPWASPLRGAPLWHFGDDTSATGTAITHTYTRPGRYTVSVTQADGAGTSSATAPISIIAPTLTSHSQPNIRGVPKVGQRLECLTRGWTGTAPIRYRYAWLRNNRAILGATHRRYTLRRQDTGTSIACRVTAKNVTGTISKTSRTVSVKP